MIRIASRDSLAECFRPIDRPSLEPQLSQHGPSFPLDLRDTFTWGDPGGPHAWLVFEDPEKRGNTLGIAFKRSDQPSPLGMCEWCHSTLGTSQVSLLTAQATKNRRVGIYVCRDLGCVARVQENVDTVAPRERVRRVLERIALLARQSLF